MDTGFCQQVADNFDKVMPPDTVGVVFEVTGRRHAEAMLNHVAGDFRAIFAYQHAL